MFTGVNAHPTKMHFDALIASWNQWLLSSNDLMQVLHEQTAAITLRNHVRQEEIDSEITHCLAELAALDEQASGHANALAAEKGLSRSSLGWKGCLEKAAALELLAMANQVKVAARELDVLMEKNRQLAIRLKDQPLVRVKRTRRRRMVYGEALAA